MPAIGAPRKGRPYTANLGLGADHPAGTAAARRLQGFEQLRGRLQDLAVERGDTGLLGPHRRQLGRLLHFLRHQCSQLLLFLGQLRLQFLDHFAQLLDVRGLAAVFAALCALRLVAFAQLGSVGLNAGALPAFDLLRLAAYRSRGCG